MGIFSCGSIFMRCIAVLWSGFPIPRMALMKDRSYLGRAHTVFPHSPIYNAFSNLTNWWCSGIAGASKDPPRNSRAAGLRSAEREQREKDRKEEEAREFQATKLMFERERAAFKQQGQQKGCVSVECCFAAMVGSWREKIAAFVGGFGG